MTMRGGRGRGDLGTADTPLPGREEESRRPDFFMSYAPVPCQPGEDPDGPDRLATEFFEDLCQEVRSARGPAVAAEAGQFGPTLAEGAAWSDRLGHELAACRVFVPLYSPRYFASTLCSREFSTFLQRADRAAPVEPPIVPVLWTPMHRAWPRVPAPPVSFGDTEMDVRFSTSGLYGLMALRDDDADYRTVLSVVRDRIVHLATASPIPSGLPVDLDTHRDPFALPPRSPLGLYLLAPTTGRLPAGRYASQYGETALEWNPYSQETPNNLVKHMADIATNLGYSPAPIAFDAALDHMLRNDPVNGPAVLVVDPWALDDPDWRAGLRAFDRRDCPWVGIVVAWDFKDQQTQDEQQRLIDQLNDTLAHRFAQRRIALRLDAGIASTLTDFGRTLSAIVQEAATQYLRQAPFTPHPTAPASAPRPSSGRWRIRRTRRDRNGG
jgi:FxsC-like protein